MTIDAGLPVARDATVAEASPPPPRAMGDGGAAPEARVSDAAASSDGGADAGNVDAATDGRPTSTPPSSPPAAVPPSPSSADAAVLSDAALDARGDGAVDASNDHPTDAGPATDAGGMPPPLPDAAPAADAAAVRAPRPGELAIVEVLANPKGNDLGREWVEVLSLAAEPVSLADLHVADAATDEPAGAGIIAPGGRIVLGQSVDPTKNGGIASLVPYGTRLILNNEDEQLSICVGPCAAGVVMDRLTWGTLGASYDGHAIVVDPTTKALCPATQPFGTAGDFGTPGQPNAPCPVADSGSQP